MKSSYSGSRQVILAVFTSLSQSWTKSPNVGLTGMITNIFFFSFFLTFKWGKRFPGCQSSIPFCFILSYPIPYHSIPFLSNLSYPIPSHPTDIRFCVRLGWKEMEISSIIHFVLGGYYYVLLFLYNHLSLYLSTYLWFAPLEAQNDHFGEEQYTMNECHLLRH